MAEDTDNKQQPQPIVVRTINRLLKLFGATFPKDVPIPKPVNRQSVNDFTYTELRHITGFQKDYKNEGVDSGLIEDYVRNIADKSKSWAKEARNLKVLTPEIEKAKNIVVSTILSPTDLQTSNIGVTVSNTGLGEDLEGEIGKELQDFFNNEYDLGLKAAKWIGEALFETGASIVLVLPEKNLDLMNKALDLDYLNAGVDPNDQLMRQSTQKRPYDVNYSSEGISVSTEALISCSSEQLDIIKEKTFDDFMISLTNKVEEEDDSIFDLDSVEYRNVKTAVEGVTSKVSELINQNNKHIMFTRDPTILQATNTKINNRIDELKRDIQNNFLFDKMNPTFVASLDKKSGHQETPIVMKIPYHAVVPVTVPNAPETHIGYFIIVDEWGTPLNEAYYDVSESTGGKKLSESGMQAMFGRPVSTALSNIVAETSRFEAASNIFGIMLRHMMDAKLNDFGLTGANVVYKEAVSSCLFRQLLHKKRVGLVFIPEPLIMYLCYDHNDDGTGKSCIQDTNMLIALRNTLVISGIMAATENSIDKKKIEVAVDEKNANVEQTLNMVRNAFIEKNMMRFDNNPHTIQRDLVQKSMTIYPKGVKGLSDSLNVSIDRAQTNSIEPTDALIEKLTDWIIMSLIVPATALNKTGEEEYSRSIATTNLFFNNEIRKLQRSTSRNLTKLIKLYLYYSGDVRNKLHSILEKSISKSHVKREVEIEDTAESTEAVDSKQVIDNVDLPEDSGEVTDEETRDHKLLKPKIKQKPARTNTDSINANILRIIDNVSINLPAPRIVVDKAHFEEIQNYIGTLDTILSAVYSDELTMEMDTYAQPLKLLRATIKDEMIRDYVKSIGFQSNYNLPSISDIHADEFEEMLIHLINVKKGAINIDNHIAKQVIVEEDQSNMFGGGGSDFGGSGSDFGGGGSDFGGGGDDFGGGDFSSGNEAEGDEPAAPEDETSEAEETPTKDDSPPGGSPT